jgi:hypothetical protein
MVAGVPRVISSSLIGPEGDERELDAVVAGGGERDVAADADASGVHLAGGEVPALAPVVGQLVRSALPFRLSEGGLLS